MLLQVIGEDSIVAAVGAEGNFELNAVRPTILSNVLHSARIFGAAAEKLRRYSVGHRAGPAEGGRVRVTATDARHRAQPAHRL